MEVKYFQGTRNRSYYRIN